MKRLLVIFALLVLLLTACAEGETSSELPYDLSDGYQDTVKLEVLECSGYETEYPEPVDFSLHSIGDDKYIVTPTVYVPQGKVTVEKDGKLTQSGQPSYTESDYQQLESQWGYELAPLFEVTIVEGEVVSCTALQ